MTTIQLSDKTIAAFKTLHAVDQSLHINHEDVVDSKTILRSKSYNKTTCCKIEVDQEFPRDLNIYDVAQFISVLNIVQNPVVDLSKDGCITIKSTDGKQKLRYLEANPDMVESYASRDPNLAQEDIQFVVTEQQFKSVLTAASTMKLEFVGFSGDGEQFYINAFNKNENGDENETNNYKVELGESEQTFNMFYKLGTQNIQMLTNRGDLCFTIDGKAKISKVEASSGEVFWFTFNASSEWQFSEDE